MTDRILAIAAAAAALAALPAAAQNVGVTSAVVNDVRMTSDTNRTLHKAVVKERVGLGNDIVTGRASRLQVLLLDKTSFTVGANAKVKVDRFVYDPDRKSSAVGMTVTRGAFRFMSGRPTHNARGQSTLRTPTASIGIRGTIVEGVVGEDALGIARAQGLDLGTVDPSTATLVLLRGPGSATQGGESAGAIDVTPGGLPTVSIETAGYAVFLPAAGYPAIGPFLLSPEASAMLTDMLRNPSYRLQQMEYPLPANPVTGRNGVSEPVVRQVGPLRPGGQGGIGADPVAPPGQGQPGVPSPIPGAGGSPLRI